MQLGSLESTQEARVDFGCRLEQLLHFFRALQTSRVHLWLDIRTLSMNRFLIGLGKLRHCQTCLECRFSWNENLQRSKKWTAKSTILKENAGKVASVFVIRSANEPKSLDVALNIAGVENYARKTCECGETGGHSRRVLNARERSVSDGGICVLCGRWFSNQFKIVSETHFSCDTAGRELLWEGFLLYAVLWNGLEHSHRKARLCVYFILF